MKGFRFAVGMMLMAFALSIAHSAFGQSLPRDVANLNQTIAQASNVAATNPSAAPVIDAVIVSANAGIKTVLPPAQPAQPTQPAQPAQPPPSPGKPGPANTGLSNPALLKAYSGPMTITAANTKIENADWKGMLTFSAKNCSIINSRGNANGASHALQNVGGTADPASNSVTISHCDLSGSTDSVTFGQNYTITDSVVHDSSSDGINGGWNTDVERNYIYNLGSGDGAHADGFQAVNGQNIKIIGNNFATPSHSIVNGVTMKVNSCIFLNPPSGNAISNVTISGNWLTGGNYAIYAAGDSNVNVTNNQFGPIDINTGQQYGNVYGGTSTLASFKGNTDYTGKPLN